jgi:hypothetical protein
MLYRGSQTQRLNSPCRICLSKDTFSQLLPYICLVYTDGCQTRYGEMSAAGCTEAKRTKSLVQYCNDGSIALSNGGRPRKALWVSTDQTLQTIACFLFSFSSVLSPARFHMPAMILATLIQAIAPTHTPPPSGGTGGGPGDRTATLSVVSRSPPRGDRLPPTR